jgi:hypothetical protein
MKTLQVRWGYCTAEKMEAVRGMIREAEVKWPGLTNYLNRAPAPCHLTVLTCRHAVFQGTARVGGRSVPRHLSWQGCRMGPALTWTCKHHVGAS